MISFLHNCTAIAPENSISCQRIVSTSSDETNSISRQGTAYQFKVNYTKAKDLRNGQCITGPPFKSNGYKWILHCYPNGSGKDHDKDHIGVFLELLSDYINLHVCFTLAIMDVQQISEPLQRKFDGKFRAKSKCGMHCFTSRTRLEQRCLSRDGYFLIICAINATGQDCDGVPRVPIGGVKEDLRALWESGDMTDVNFDVEGVIISAHKVILAARSSVFKAELFGHMAESTSECIRINEMKPEVFRALIRFMYDNSLDNEGDTNLTQHIMAAADRYAVDGLIARCEKYLMENRSFDTVIDVLMFSERHNFVTLKEACIEFASRVENFTRLAFTDEYIQMAQAFPSLWAYLREKVRATHFLDRFD